MMSHSSYWTLLMRMRMRMMMKEVGKARMKMERLFWFDAIRMAIAIVMMELFSKTW